MKLLRNLIILIIIFGTAIVGAMFATQNTAQVPLDLLIYTFEPQTLALWVLGAFALGGTLGMIVSSIILIRMRASLGARNRQLDRARTEVSKLRDESVAVVASTVPIPEPMLAKGAA